MEMINVALPKGRLGEKVYDMFEKAGFPCPSIKENNRKLIFENKEVGVRYFWVKPSDVAIYVERGAADIGVAGKDILLEYNPDVYELLDLNIGKCDMAVAAKADFVDDRNKTLTVATKFTNIAKKYYASQGREIDIIHLNGSIELAPILELSDVIVDIVETGATLKENKLEVVEKFLPISARLIANKANFKFKSQVIEKIITELSEKVKAKDCVPASIDVEEGEANALDIYRQYEGKAIKRKDGFAGTIKKVENDMLFVDIIAGPKAGTETKIQLSFVLGNPQIYQII